MRVDTLQHEVTVFVHGCLRTARVVLGTPPVFDAIERILAVPLVLVDVRVPATNDFRSSLKRFPDEIIVFLYESRLRPTVFQVVQVYRFGNF